MPKRIVPLTDVQVKNAKAEGGKAVTLFDGGGLYLSVEPSGAKGWRLKYRFNGKGRLISLGTYPETTLAGARKKKGAIRTQVKTGIDPSLARKAEKLDKESRQAKTFKVVAEEWAGQQKAKLAASTLKMTLGRLERDIYPAIGNVPVADLIPKMILDGVLRPMERRGVVELAHRTKSIISRILRYGVACGYLERDISADLRGALQTFSRKHMAAPTDPKEVAGILRAIDGFEGSFIVKCALRLHPLVVTRPGELRGAEWSEVDLETATWEIPAERMKTGNPHIVPLSEQALAILHELHPLTGSGKYLFPSIRSTAKPISNNTLNAGLRRLGITKEELVSHGWRAVFRTLGDEVLQFRPDFIEHQLAHAVKDPNGRAYNRTSHLAERKKMMQTWADYLEGLKAGAKVIPLRKV
jgi:integrase